MFKKPLADLKTSAPLRSSDRRKLKQRILQAYPVLPSEEGDVLVPDGLQSQKFSTHLEEPGVVYLSSDGDPLWFTIGKGSGDLIPTVYTLWKRPDLLPFLSTPSAVVPKLIGGADLMIPGGKASTIDSYFLGDLWFPKEVVQHSPPLTPDQLVSITQYHRGAFGPPIAVGWMAVSSDALHSAEEKDIKGKAVYVIHTWKDALWEMGPSKGVDPPVPREMTTAGQTEDFVDSSEDAIENETVPAGGEAAADAPAETQEETLTPEDVSSVLRAAVLQVIGLRLAHALPSTFPISASMFWSAYVLPARPAHALSANGLVDARAVDIKQSTYKNVKTFLKACAKEGLLKLKETKGDIQVTAVYPQHPAVAEKRPHRTIGDLEAKAKKAEDSEQKEREAEDKRKGEMQVSELWTPDATTVPLFVAAEKDTSDMYTITDITEIVNDYISSHGLINPNDQQYINVGTDQALASAVSIKGQDAEFLKRDVVLKRVRTNMQAWYEIRLEGREVIRKKGKLKPISIVVKIRQGRKACTLLTGYEPFGLQADDLAEELRKTCASSTSVSPVQGKPNMLEVMVQGKQAKAVTDLLVARGVPKMCINGSDQGEKKKKK